MTATLSKRPKYRKPTEFEFISGNDWPISKRYSTVYDTRPSKRLSTLIRSNVFTVRHTRLKVRFHCVLMKTRKDRNDLWAVVSHSQVSGIGEGHDLARVFDDLSKIGQTKWYGSGNWIVERSLCEVQCLANHRDYWETLCRGAKPRSSHTVARAAVIALYLNGFELVTPIHVRD